MTLYAALVIDACRRLSLVDRALEIAQATIAVAERRDERIALPEIHRARGEILKDRDKAEAEAAFLSAIEIAREQGSTLLELRAGVSMCGVAAGPKKKRARADVARVLTAFGDDGLDLPDTRDARAIADS
jgi:hypothetical protein